IEHGLARAFAPPRAAAHVLGAELARVSRRNENRQDAKAAKTRKKFLASWRLGGSSLWPPLNGQTRSHSDHSRAFGRQLVIRGVRPVSASCGRGLYVAAHGGTMTKGSPPRTAPLPACRRPRRGGRDGATTPPRGAQVVRAAVAPKSRA